MLTEYASMVLLGQTTATSGRELGWTPLTRNFRRKQGHALGIQTYCQKSLVLYAPNTNYFDIWAVANGYYYSVYIFQAS